MARKYLKITIEGKNLLVDLEALPSSQVKFSLGEIQSKEFISSKSITLDKLEEIL